MTNFAINKMPVGPVNFMEEDKTENVNSAAVGDRAISLAAAKEVQPDATREAARIGDQSVALQAKQDSNDLQYKMVQESLRSGDVDLETLSAAVTMAPEKVEIQAELEDFFIEQGMMVEGVDYTPSDLRYATNTLIAEQIFRDRIAQVEDDTGVMGVVTDFIDRYLIRQIPVGMVEDLTGRATRKGEELAQAAITMNPKQYREYITNYVEELSAEGFFKSDNIFALQDGFDEAINAGYDPLHYVKAGFAVTEVVGLGKVARAGLKTLSKADSTVGRVAAVKGQDTATDVAEKAIEVTGGLDNVVKTKSGPGAFDEGTSVVRPRSSKVIEIAENNVLWQKVRELDKKGVFGRMANPEEIKVKGRKVVDDYKKRTNNSFNNYNILEDLAGNMIVRTDFGKVKDGGAYTRLADAEKAAARTGIPEAQAAPIDPEDLSQGFVVRMETRLDLTDVADEFDVDDLGYDAVRTNLARLFGSNASLDDEYLSALANMGEAGATAVKEAARPFEKALNRIPRDSKIAITRVYKNLRDGPDADVKQGYTPTDFKEKFKELHPKSKSATPRDMEAFYALQQFEDAGWIIRSNKALNNYVKKGYWALDLGPNRSIGKKVGRDVLDEGEEVYDISSGNWVFLRDLDEAIPLWKLDTPQSDGAQYVVNPKSVKVLDHADVMGFNSGGRRVNPKANYFVAFDGDTPRAFLTAFSEKQAKLAVDQLNKLNGLLKSRGGLGKVKNTDEIDDFIRANNDWNPSITSLEDYAKLVKDKGWDITRKISYKQRDGEIVDEGVDSLHAGEKWDDYVKVQLNRHNDTLMDFGGGEAWNTDPVSAILGEFANAATHYTHRAYTYRAAAAWTKRAARKGSGVNLNSAYAKDDFLNQVQHAEIVGSGAAARSLRHQRSVIRRRLKIRGPVQQRFDALGQEFREFVFDKSGGRISAGPISVADSLLNVGFQSAFGFFNVSQFFMQGFHAATIMAISPIHGTKAAGMAIPLRMAINAGSPEAQKLALKRLAKFTGDTEENMAELVEYVRTSGRDVIDGDAIELGTGPSYGISGWGEHSYLPSRVSTGLQKASSGGKKLLDVGLQPFKQGERLARLSGMTTAFLEYKAKFGKGASVLSDEGRRWVTTREQNLTFNMTSSARPAFQEGVMKVPTQWLSYTFRAAEAVVVGRGFTAAERGRMALALMPFYGLTGMGLGSAADYLTDKMGIEDPELYIGLKYGFIDYLISEITPVETALATRLAPLTGFTDLWGKIAGGDATMLQILGGPSGDIASGILGQFVSTLGELYHGNTVSLTEDALAILRQPSGIDNMAKGWGILQNGIYRSKTGTVLPIEMKPSDALISFMGFSPLEVSEFYSLKTDKYKTGKKLTGFKKEMQKDYQRALQIGREDPEKGIRMVNEIIHKIALSPFSKAQQMEVRGGLKDVGNRELYDLFMDLIKRDRNSTALIAEELLGGE